MSHRLREASMEVVPGRSAVVPVALHGLPAEIEALGARWRRKRELHMTALSAKTIERAAGGTPELWDRVVRLVSGRSVGPINARREVRRVRDPSRPQLETLVVMVDAPGLEQLHRDLSVALGVELSRPPAHVTLYSTDPAEGIGLHDAEDLATLAPELNREEQDEIRRAIGFDEVLFDDEGIPFDRVEDSIVVLGETEGVFTPRFMRALAYAAHLHRDQPRKGTGAPYLSHLLAVTAYVAGDGGDEIQAIGAVLHDTAEDHGGESRLRDVRRRFGPEVEAIVRALSDSLEPEGEPKEKWRPRKERYLAHLRNEDRAGVLRVSNADKLHNARSMLADLRLVGDALWERFEGPRPEQLWYYGELASIFAEKRPGSSLSGELSETVAQLRREAAAGGG